MLIDNIWLVCGVLMRISLYRLQIRTIHTQYCAAMAAILIIDHTSDMGEMRRADAKWQDIYGDKVKLKLKNITD